MDHGRPEDAREPGRSDLSDRSFISFQMIALIIAATAVGFAIFQKGGEYTPIAITLITVALLATIAATVCSRISRQFHWPNTWITYAIGIALAIQFFALITLWPVGADHVGRHLGLPNHVVYLILTALAGALALGGILGLPSLREGWFPALLLAHLLLGFWTIRSSPLPRIDVWYFQEDGSIALLHGLNPYDAEQVRFRDIYDSTLPGQQQVYGDGMVEHGMLKFGFPYPPLSLYCSTAGFLLGQDTRFAQAIALTLAGLLLGYCRTGQLPKLAAAMLMFTPQEWFILGRAWTEPFVVMFLAGVIFCAFRKLKWLLPIALGLFLASKQYLVFAIPLTFLLIDEFDRRSAESWRRWGMLLLKSGIVALLVTLPIALKNFHAFWFSTVTVQEVAPFRWDALSYMVWAGHFHSRITTWSWVPFAALVPTTALAMRKGRRSPAGFALALALVYLIFIAFNKQAFCNYYFFVIGCLCCAIGAAKPTGPAVTGECGDHLLGSPIS